jgi:hypothetical protein
MAPDVHRGKLGTVFQISICATILLAQIVNYVGRPDDSIPLSNFSWRLQFGLGAIPGLLILIVSPFLTESTKWTQSNAEWAEHKMEGEVGLSCFLLATFFSLLAPICWMLCVGCSLLAALC